MKVKKWKMWYAFLDLRTCIECKRKHGKVYALEEKPKPSPPLHNNCRCEIIKMKAVLAGNATDKGERGADWYIKYYTTLPDYYGENLSALWDCLRYYSFENTKIVVKGISELPSELQEYMNSILEVFEDVHTENPAIIFEIV